MLDVRESFESFDELEALVLSAKDYVRPSDDLRPQLLEAARRECRERRVADCLRIAAVAVLLLGVSFATLREQFKVLGQIQSASVAAAVSEILSPAQAMTPSADVHWHMVDSFTELRRRQADLLRAAPELPQPDA